jgi:hypothetical protein
MKVIIYNIFLQPWKVDAKLKEKMITKNLKLIGLIIYHLTLEVV